MVEKEAQTKYNHLSKVSQEAGSSLESGTQTADLPDLAPVWWTKSTHFQKRRRRRERKFSFLSVCREITRGLWQHLQGPGSCSVMRGWETCLGATVKGRPWPASALGPGQACAYERAKGADLILPHAQLQVQFQVREGFFWKEKKKGREGEMERGRPYLEVTK